MVVRVELGDVRNHAVEERGAVVTHHDERPTELEHEALEPIEPGEVEVVGGFVEK